MLCFPIKKGSCLVSRTGWSGSIAEGWNWSGFAEKALDKWWLEDDTFLLGPSNFSELYSKMDYLGHLRVKERGHPCATASTAQPDLWHCLRCQQTHGHVIPWHAVTSSHSSYLQLTCHCLERTLFLDGNIHSIVYTNIYSHGGKTSCSMMSWGQAFVAWLPFSKSAGETHHWGLRRSLEWHFDRLQVQHGKKKGI